MLFGCTVCMQSGWVYHWFWWSVLTKGRHIKFGRRGITQKKAYSIEELVIAMTVMNDVTTWTYIRLHHCEKKFLMTN
jgi:hypothetical protein